MPAAHRAHDVAPGAEANVPASHGAHLVSVVPPHAVCAKLPAGHTAHALHLPPALNAPGGHVPH